jgi:glucose/arabinose dehydrogenase
MRRPFALPMVLIAAVLAACSDNAVLPPGAGVGADPVLPVPSRSSIVNVAPARGWAAGGMPVAAPGLRVTAFAGGLDHPRWLHVLPNGDVLVAESNKQPKPPKSLRDIGMKLAMGVAGAEAASADRITLLRDGDGDGTAESRSAFLTDLTSPFGMALVGSVLYVADTDALLRFPYRDGAVSIAGRGEVVAALPAGEINHHWTKGLVADDGALFVSVGSNSDHGENGLAAEAGRAAIWRIAPTDGRAEIYASGLRNPVGMAVEPESGALWAVVNERDELGGDLVPDYLTQVRAGAFYGWPFSYYGDHLDPRVTPQRPDLVATARRPDYALGSHVAPLGLAFAEGADLGPRFAEGAFIGEHGSWNRKPRSGYRVVFVPFRDGRPSGRPVDVLAGFLDGAGLARGRPVGVAVDGRGGLLVADDVGNMIWRVSAE